MYAKIVVVAFSVVAALVAPALLALVRDAIWCVTSWLPDWRSAADNRPYQRPLGVVPARMVLDLALREKSDFLLRLHDNHEKTREDAARSRRQVGDLTATTLLLLLADGVLSPADARGTSLVAGFASHVGSWWPWIIMLTVLSAGAVLKWAWFADPGPSLIYYPPLDDELRAKERARRTD